MMKNVSVSAVAAVFVCSSAGAQIAPSDWTCEGQIRVGATKQEFDGLASAHGVRMACVRPAEIEVPVGNVEVCRWAAGSRTVSAVIALDHRGASRVVAYSVKGPSTSFSDLRDGLIQKLGRPARRTNGLWGENIVWQLGAYWTALHSACATQRSCLEVSQDMTARRLARSSGVFMPVHQSI